MYRRQTPSLYRGESVSLLYREEAYTFSIQKRECPLAICTGGRLLLRLYAMGIVSSPHGGEIALLLYVKEADSFSVQKRESVFSRQSRECVLLRSLDPSMMMYPVVWGNSDCHFAKGSAVASRIHWQATCQLMRLSNA